MSANRSGSVSMVITGNASPSSRPASLSETPAGTPRISASGDIQLDNSISRIPSGGQRLGSASDSASGRRPPLVPSRTGSRQGTRNLNEIQKRNDEIKKLKQQLEDLETVFKQERQTYMNKSIKGEEIRRTIQNQLNLHEKTAMRMKKNSRTISKLRKQKQLFKQKSDHISIIRKKLEDKIKSIESDINLYRRKSIKSRKDEKKLQRDVNRKEKEISELREQIEKFQIEINELRSSSPQVTTMTTQTSPPKTTTTSTQTSPKKTPSPKPAIIQPLVTNQSVNKIVKAITERNAKVPTTPPGVTKTNLQKFLAPFKQPVSIKFAPSIQATGGTGGNATIIQTKNKKNDDKKKKKPFKKFNVLADPASAYRKSVAASKRKEIMTRLRTPTVGQRKKHVIELIDKELRLMKVPKDIERKMISLYSKGLSEKQIKQLFGGRSTGDVKKILKKQVDYFKKKKR